MVLMDNKNFVSHLGNGKYRFEFSQPIKFGENFLLLAGTHKINVLSPKDNSGLVIAVEGQREALLSWFRSLEIIDAAQLKEIEDAMTD